MQSIVSITHINSNIAGTSQILFTCSYNSHLGNQSRVHTVTLYPSQVTLITCRNESMEGYYWPETAVNDTSYQSCKEGGAGKFIWLND